MLSALLARFPVFGLDIEGQGGAIYFDSGTNGLLGGEPVMEQGYKFAGFIRLNQNISDAARFGIQVEQDPVLLDRLLFSAGYRVAGFDVQGGTFFSPSRVTSINPGLFAGASFKSGVFSSGFGIDFTVLPLEVGKYTQALYEAALGLTFPHLNIAFNIDNKSFMEQRVNFSIVSVDHIRYQLGALFSFDFGAAPRTLSFGINGGFRQIRWENSHIIDDSYTYRAFYTGLTAAFAVNPQFKLYAGGSYPFYFWTEDAGGNPGTHQALFYEAFLGISLSASRKAPVALPPAKPAIAPPPGTPRELPEVTPKGIPADFAWYVMGRTAMATFRPLGNDGNTGAVNSPLSSVQQALSLIRSAYAAHKQTDWPKRGNEPRPAVIIIAGDVTDFGQKAAGSDMIEIAGTDAYPPIILRGKGSGAEAGVLNAGGKGRVLNITGGNRVRLEDNLSIVGGQSDTGGAIYITRGECILSGNVTVRDNTSNNLGGGIYVADGKLEITDNAGIINNTARYLGGGVVVGQNGICTLDRKAKISGNTANTGGGVCVLQNGSLLIVNSDAAITSNKAAADGTSGGGVYIDRGTFETISDITVRDNIPNNIYR
jgi:predicted outer membrane repeat protein